jgi:hypothetical protein
MKRIVSVVVVVSMLLIPHVRSGYAGCSGCEVWLPLLGMELVTIGIWAATAPQYNAPPPEKPQSASPPIYTQPYVQPEVRPAYPGFWYYCQNPEGYYPDVARCPGGWIKVPPNGPRRPPVDPPRE